MDTMNATASRTRSAAVELREGQREERARRAPAATPAARRGIDAYGCVDWFDFAPERDEDARHDAR